MITYSLNLLSPLKKNKLSKLLRWLFIKEILEISLFTSAILAIIYVAGWLVLVNFLSELSGNATLINHGNYKLNQKVATVNGLIKKMDLSSATFKPVSPYLTKIADSLPGDIRIFSITIDNSGKQLLISGMAKTRSALLLYQTNLHELKWLSAITLPTSDFIQKENIPFEIKAVLL